MQLLTGELREDGMLMDFPDLLDIYRKVILNEMLACIDIS